MSVPPTRRSSSTPPSKGKPDEAKNKEGKDFKLPSRKQPVESKEEKEKKKNLFDIAGEKKIEQWSDQRLAQDYKTEEIKAGEVSKSQATAQVQQVSQLVQRMVETMRIGQIDGKTFASLDLKQGADVPQAFAGSHLTVSYQENGIVIRFDHFMSAQQQNTAITLVEKNKEQLEEMIRTLNAKNIQVHELAIGEHSVTLPRVAPLPPPFQPTSPPRSDAEQQRDRGGREGGQGEGRGEGLSRGKYGKQIE
jgi:hypothetical protein